MTFPSPRSRAAPEDGVERVGRVRVVDDDRERLPLVDRLEAARARPRPRAMPSAIASSSMSRRSPAATAPRAFSTLKLPRSRRLDLDARRAEPAPVRASARRPPGGSPPASSPNVTSGARWASSRSPASRLPPLVADVDRGRRRRRAREEPPLRVEVVLHRPVQVEVVLAQVREDERVEADAVEPPERRAVRRRLEGDAPVARVEHLAEEPLEVDRLGRRERRGALLAADLQLDRARRARPARPPPRASSGAGTPSSSSRSSP